MAMKIPSGSIEIQKGLFLYEYYKTLDNRTYTLRDLYSADGYCFYDLEQPENYDEDGNLKPENERVYTQFTMLAISQSVLTYEQINERYISVPINENYNI